MTKVDARAKAKVIPRIATVTLNPAIDLTLHVPALRVGTVHRVEASRSNAGGKGINVASLLADAGFAVTATGWLGDDNGGIFARLFARKRIRDHFVYLRGETRTNVKLVDAGARTTTDINGIGLAPSAEDVAALLDRVEAMAKDHDWVVLAGSLPEGAPDAIYAALIAGCLRAGARVALDTSGVPLARGLAAHPTLVKPNSDELAALGIGALRSIDDISVAARALVATGIDEVAVSMGSRGALFVTAKETLWARPPRVEVASTVGAGDAMVAGLVAGHCRGLDLAERARLATAFAAHAVSIIGNDLAPDARLRALQAAVQLQSIPLTTLG